MVIPTLCFDAVIAVLEKGAAEFRLNKAPVGVRLARHGDVVEIVSNAFPSMTFPLGPVLEGLVDCGDRFLRVVADLWAGLQYDDALTHIASAGETARKALYASGRARPDCVNAAGSADDRSEPPLREPKRPLSGCNTRMP